MTILGIIINLFEDLCLWIPKSTVINWIPETRNMVHPKTGHFSVQYSNGPTNPDFLKINLKIQTFLRSNFKWSGFQKVELQLQSRFQMFFDKMAVICPDFKWMGFQISDPIPNPDHLQTNL